MRSRLTWVWRQLSTPNDTWAGWAVGVVVVVPVVTVAGWYVGDWWFALILGTAMIGASAARVAVKTTLGRRRPEHG